MKYSEFRAVAQDGDILFLYKNKNDPLSRLISWWTNSPYTHAAFVFWYRDRLMVAESTTHGGSRIVSASTYADRELDILPAVRPWAEIQDQALERSGTAEYGWFSAIYIGLREWALVHLGVRLPQDQTNHNKACSEFVAEILELPDVDISPGQLYRQLKK
jgi:hypothetical protein